MANLYSLKHKLLHYLKWKLFKDYPRLSYSRAGEDAILMEVFASKSYGFFVDVGAYHPVESSNTFRFYQNGWRGINIDPNSRAIAQFNKLRPRDINLNYAIDTQSGTTDYYTFKEKGFDQMNTISESFKEFAVNEFQLTVDSKIEIKTSPLRSILDEYLPANTTIDFMSVDVEGKDLEVLQSNDWNKYRPTMVVAEISGKLSEINDFEITRFMQSQNYVPVAFNLVTLDRGNIFFLDKK